MGSDRLLFAGTTVTGRCLERRKRYSVSTDGRSLRWSRYSLLEVSLWFLRSVRTPRHHCCVTRQSLKQGGRPNSLGNNDLYRKPCNRITHHPIPQTDVIVAHNIMYPGPNEVTQVYRDIWKSIIPFPSYSVFQRGAYFSVEVVPDHLGHHSRLCYDPTMVLLLTTVLRMQLRSV